MAFFNKTGLATVKNLGLFDEKQERWWISLWQGDG